MPAWYERIGQGTAKEAVADLAPLLDDIMSRLRGTAYESVERFNGAKVELSIVDNKVVIVLTLPPVSPPAVRNP